MKKLTQAQSTIFAAIITGVFAIIVATFAWFNNPSSSIIVAQLPSSVPSLTPKPTVVGTPVDFIGVDLSVRGEIGYSVFAGNITLVIDEVKAYRQTFKGFSARAGYAFVVIKIRVSNNSHHYISSLQTTVADDLNNQYAPKIMAGHFDLPELPSLQYGDSGAGAIVYEVPEVALSNHLRFWLEPENWVSDNDLTVKIEIMFPPVVTIVQ